MPRDCFPFQPYLFWNRCYNSKLISLWRCTLFSISTGLLWVRALRKMPSGQSFPQRNNQSLQIADYRGGFIWQLTLLVFFFFFFKQLIVCQHVGSINNLLQKIISATNSKKLLLSKNPLQKIEISLHWKYKGKSVFKQQLPYLESYHATVPECLKL